MRWVLERRKWRTLASSFSWIAVICKATEKSPEWLPEILATLDGGIRKLHQEAVLIDIQQFKLEDTDCLVGRLNNLKHDQHCTEHGWTCQKLGEVQCAAPKISAGTTRWLWHVWYLEKASAHLYLYLETSRVKHNQTRVEWRLLPNGSGSPCFLGNVQV